MQIFGVNGNFKTNSKVVYSGITRQMMYWFVTVEGVFEWDKFVCNWGPFATFACQHLAISHNRTQCCHQVQSVIMYTVGMHTSAHLYIIM